ncbi:hypothetical protein ACQEVF_22665 [Nonomuraea polychroma]|uniref:hypothetical protein n=1 Tax=Nonomuraea polychroma TaxID=46176 RepID=UPI003D8FFCDE
MGDELLVGGDRVQVRSLQTLGQRKELVPATARVAVSLKGVDRSRSGRITVARSSAITSTSADSAERKVLGGYLSSLFRPA